VVRALGADDARVIRAEGMTESCCSSDRGTNLLKSEGRSYGGELGVLMRE
jgi:hypothetical protein